MIKKQPSGEKMLRNRPTIESRVKQILIDYPPTKGDDLLLVYRYWQRHANIKISFRNFKDLFYAPSTETICRSRRRVQAKDPSLKPTKRVVRKREINEEAHVNYHSGGLKLTDFVEEAI